VGDANAALAVLEGRALTGALAEAAELLALVAGHDVETAEGVFRIARKVAHDRACQRFWITELPVPLV